MPAMGNGPDLTTDDVTVLDFCFVPRSDPATLVFVACSECGAVVNLAESVRNLYGSPTCWDCGVLSLHD